MRTTRHTRSIAALAAVAALSLGALTGCAGGAASETGAGDTGADGSAEMIGPVTMEATALAGANVELRVDQVLNINTGDHDVEHYSGVVQDPSVAEFTPGDSSGTAVFNPGVTALAPGTTTVTLTDAVDGSAEITFTVMVTAP